MATISLPGVATRRSGGNRPEEPSTRRAVLAIPPSADAASRRQVGSLAAIEARPARYAGENSTVMGNASVTDNPGVHVPPPIFYMTAIAAGAWLQQVVPLPIGGGA